MAEEIIVPIKADTDQATKAIGKMEKTTEKSVGSMEKSFSALKVVAGAAVALFAGKAVLNFFSEGIDSAVAQEKAMARLSVQMQLTGEYTEAAAKQFNDLASELESTTTFGDDAILNAAALAKSYGLTNDQTQALVRASTDLAAATGVSLDTAVEQLSVSYAGNVKSLGKLVPEVRGLTKEQLAAGAAVDLLAARFKGAGQAELLTYSGAVTQAKNAFINFQESFGTIITQNKAVIATINGVSKLFRALQKVVEDNQGAFDALINFGLKAMVVGMSITIQATQGLINILALAASSVISLFSTIIEGWGQIAGFLSVIPGMEGISNALLDASKGMDDFNNALLDGTANADKILQEVNDSVDAFGQGIFDATEKTDVGMGKAAKATKAVGRAAVVSAEDVAKLADEATKFLAEVNTATLSELQKLDQKTSDQFKKLEELYKKGALTRAQQSAASVQITQADSTARVAIQKKENDEVQKFIGEIGAATKSEYVKIDETTAAHFQKLGELYAAGKVSRDQLSIASVQIAQADSDARLAIQTKENEKTVADAKKVADEARAAIEKAAADPIKFAIAKLDIPALDIQQSTKEGAAAGLGLAAKALDGAAGAKSLISGAAGAIGDAMIPGIGGAVGGLISKLAEGPDAVKEFITGFIEGVPGIITAIAESIPVVIDTLIDVLINKGGLIKIVVALGKAMLSLMGFKQIGKLLGGSFTGAINPAGLGKKLSEGVIKPLTGFITKFHQMHVTFTKNLVAGIGKAFMAIFGVVKKIHEASVGFTKRIVMAIVDFVKKFTMAHITFTKKLVEGIVNVIKRIHTASVEFTKKIVMAIVGFAKKIHEASVAFTKKLIEGIVNIVKKLHEASVAFTKKLVEGIVNVVKKIHEASVAFTKKIVEGIVNFAKKIWDAVTGVISRIHTASVEFTKKLVAGIVSAAQKLWTAITSAFSSAMSALGSFFSTLWTYFVQAATLLVNTLYKFWTETVPGLFAAAWNGLKTFFTETLPGLFTSAFSGIKTFFEGLGTWISRAFSGVTNWFSNLGSTVWNAFVKVFNKLIEILSGGLGGGGGKDYSKASTYGFATGGVVPPKPIYAAGGYVPRGTDSVRAMLTPGEMVLNKSQQTSLFNQLKGGDGGGGGDNSALLQELIDLLSMPMTTEVVAKLNEKTFADLILQQSRQRARLTA